MGNVTKVRDIAFAAIPPPTYLSRNEIEVRNERVQRGKGKIYI